MTKNNDKRCLFMGLPNSGKSTFIAALWHELKSKEVQTLYSIETEPENRTYLNSLLDAWLEFRSPGRTSNTGFSNIITVKVLDNNSKQVFDLVFPDASGEFYEAQFAFRNLPAEYLNMIESMAGMVVFVNPEFIIKSNLITEANEILYDKFFEERAEMLGLNVKPETPGGAANEKDTSLQVEEKSYFPWEEKFSQSQVIIVDLLQMIMDYVQRPCRIALVVSAWDHISSLPAPLNMTTPEEWFSENLPLLKQFLTVYSEIFTYSVFGVSAQGGKYDNDPKNQLYNILVPSERIQVKVDDVIERDITIPIQWVLNG